LTTTNSCSLVTYGVDTYTQEELIYAAKLANAHDFIVSFDEGYATRVGDKGTRISGGQKQRLALARVFLRKSKILLLDEATSSLDSESEAFVQESIDKLIEFGNCTVFLVAHRLSTVVNADLIAVIHNGVIHEQGTHEELVAKKGVYARLVEVQMRRVQNSLSVSQEIQQKQGPLDVIDSLIDNDS